MEGSHVRQLPNTAYELIKACASGMAMEDPATKIATANELFSELKTRGTTYILGCVSYNYNTVSLGIFYSGAPLDTSIFNVLLKVYVANDHSFTPSEFLEEMAANGVSPNQVIKNMCMVLDTCTVVDIQEHVH